MSTMNTTDTYAATYAPSGRTLSGRGHITIVITDTEDNIVSGGEVWIPGELWSPADEGRMCDMALERFGFVRIGDLDWITGVCPVRRVRPAGRRSHTHGIGRRAVVCDCDRPSANC
jgi:hypothetical protein